MSDKYFLRPTRISYFGHKNILRYCDRPFDNVWAMNHRLIQYWNMKVKTEDIVYHLGDFSFLPEKQAKEIMECLNGIKILIRGNHDKSVETMKRIGFNEVEKHLLLDINNKKIYMSHDPKYINIDICADFYLCGHVHNAWKSFQINNGPLIYNVGIDQWGYQPITVEDIEGDMKLPLFRLSGDTVGMDSKYASSV